MDRLNYGLTFLIALDRFYTIGLRVNTHRARNVPWKSKLVAFSSLGD